MQSSYILFYKSLPPFPHGGVRHTQLARNLHVALADCTQQNNLSPAHQTRRKGSRTGHTFQLFALLRTQNQSRFRSSQGHRHPHSALENANIPSNTIATYLWDKTLEAWHLFEFAALPKNFLDLIQAVIPTPIRASGA